MGARPGPPRKTSTSGQYDTHTQVLSESGETTFDASISPAPDREGSTGSHGLVGQSSEVEAIPETRVVVASLRGEAFFGVTCKADRRNGYDYLTTYAKTTLPGVPSSFKRGQRRRALAGHTEDEGWNYRLAGRASLPRGCILARTTAFGSRRHPLPWPTEYLPESVG